MTLGGAAQVAAVYCPNERTLDPAVCSYNRPTYAPASEYATPMPEGLKRLVWSLAAETGLEWSRRRLI